MANNSEEGQGSQRAVVPVMMMKYQNEDHFGHNGRTGYLFSNQIFLVRGQILWTKRKCGNGKLTGSGGQ
jgi:hypothetical protein